MDKLITCMGSVGHMHKFPKRIGQNFTRVGKVEKVKGIRQNLALAKVKAKARDTTTLEPTGPTHTHAQQ